MICRMTIGSFVRIISDVGGPVSHHVTIKNRCRRHLHR